MRAANQIFRRECLGLARPGTAAAHIHGCRPTGLAEHGRDAGPHGFVRGVADLKSRDIGDEILRSGSKQGSA